MANRGELRTRVEATTGRTDKTTLINDALDQGRVQAEREYPFSALLRRDDRAIVAGDYTAGFSLLGTEDDEIWEITDLRLIKTDQSSYPIPIVDRRVFIKRHPNVSLENQGLPVIAYFEKSGNDFQSPVINSPSLIFAPPSDGSYTLRMRVWHVGYGFTGDSDFSSDLLLDDLIVAWATAWVLRSLGQFTDAVQWDTYYDKQLGRMVRQERRMFNEHQMAPFSSKDNDVQPQPNYWEDPFQKYTP